MGRGRKYRPAKSGGQPGAEPASRSTNWQTAGVGHRLGGTAPPPAIAPERGQAPAAASSVGADGHYAPQRAAPAPSRRAIAAHATPFISERDDAPAGLQRTRESGHGNCLFHAIARQALGDPEFAGQARAQICDWMLAYLVPSAVAAGRSPLTQAHVQMIEAQRAEVFAPRKNDNDARVHRYVEKMRRDGEWGTGLEALCAAYLYSRPVHIWSPGGAQVLEPPPERRDVGATPLRLLHNGRNHWDSASPSEGFGSADGAAAIAAADIDEEALMAGVAASLADCGSDFRIAAAGGSAIACSPRKIGTSASPSDAELEDLRALQRTLSSSAALARRELEDTRGLKDANRAAELRRSQEKHALLGQLAERCARRREEMPLGAGLLTNDKLRAVVDVRAPAATIDGVFIGCSPVSGDVVDGKVPTSEARGGGLPPRTGGRWSRRHRDEAEANITGDVAF
mmetsp:Transcript_14975/g.41124  ORF Transcript_14975/g.41124 Transcript_14975/m.41124 type:complete len:455 (+) Transcript_14975:64-1428(+)